MLSHVREGSGPPLLLAHGIGMSHRAFDGVIERLAGDFEVVAVDLPGFGDSAPVRARPTVRALSDACADLMASLGHARFHAAGNSLGGAVALHLALDGRALSACGLSPIGFVSGWERAHLQASVAFARVAHRPAAALLRGPGRVGAVRRALVRVYCEHGERVPPERLIDTFGTVAEAPSYWGAMRHALGWRVPRIATLPCPVTIAWGEHDRLLLTGPQFARARECLPGAHHVTLRDCGHLPAWDDPALVAETIREAAAV